MPQDQAMLSRLDAAKRRALEAEAEGIVAYYTVLTDHHLPEQLAAQLTLARFAGTYRRSASDFPPPPLRSDEEHVGETKG
jgi:hypothetical protein